MGLMGHTPFMVPQPGLELEPRPGFGLGDPWRLPGGATIDDPERRSTFATEIQLEFRQKWEFLIDVWFIYCRFIMIDHDLS